MICYMLYVKFITKFELCEIDESNSVCQRFKFKLDNRCSNNQAEQLAIVKALEIIEM
jgi:ribonuclease HI